MNDPATVSTAIQGMKITKIARKCFGRLRPYFVEPVMIVGVEAVFRIRTQIEGAQQMVPGSYIGLSDDSDSFFSHLGGECSRHEVTSSAGG